MMISNVKTPFMKAENRLMEAFASEMETLDKTLDKHLQE